MSSTELTINNINTGIPISGNVLRDISGEFNLSGLKRVNSRELGNLDLPLGENYIEAFKKYSFNRIDESIDNLDYYMFYSYTVIFPLHNDTENENVNDICLRIWKKGVMGGVRMIICVFIQTVITPMLIYYSISSNANLCARDGTSYQKITAAIFTFYINLTSINNLSDQIHIYLNFNTFYIIYHKYLSQTKGTINKNKRRVFNILTNFYLSINIISCLLTTIGSVIIIYNSKTMLEIILNSLALKFVDEIDNMSISKSEIMVFKNDYNRIRSEIDENIDFFDKYIPNRISQTLKLVKKMCCTILLGSCLTICLYIFTIVAQIWMFICY